MRLKGSISIYFTLCIVLIISVILSVTELARYSLQKFNLQIATDAAIDSMLSLYHRKLYEYYSVYGVEYRNDDLLTKEYYSYLSPFFVDENTGKKIANYMNAYISEERVDLRHKDLVDECFFEKEIIDYMKYAILGKTIDYFGKDVSIASNEEISKLFDEAREVFEETKQTEIYSELYDRYFDFTDEIKDVEKKEKEILVNIENANKEMKALGIISISGSMSNLKNVEKKIKNLETYIDKLKNDYSELNKKIDEFSKVINENRKLYYEDKLYGKYEFNADIEEFVESEFNEFEAYILPESHMCCEIQKGNSEIEAITSGFNNIVTNIENYVSELSGIENEIKIAKKAKGDEYDADYIKDLNEEKKDIEDDISEYLKDVRESFKDVKFSELDFEISTEDHSREENLLKKLVGFKNNVLLDFVFSRDEVIEISNEAIHYANYNIASTSPYISLDKILLTEYALDKFNYYNKKNNDEITKSGSEKYEVERIITGKSSDKESINGTLTDMFLLRLAMNMLYIYKNPEMRRMVRGFTYTAFGGFSRLLAEGMFLLCITAWGSAQSIVDLKRLVKGARVNFMHNSSSWSVSINNILDIANGVFGDIDEKDDEGTAFLYKDYLRILLLSTNQSTINSRMSEIMEVNIKLEEETFDFEKLISAFEVKNEFLSTHYFTNLMFVKAKDVVIKKEYETKINGYKGFTK